MPTLLGALFAAASLYVIITRTADMPWVLSAAAPFSATAGVVIAGQSILAYPLVAIGLIVITLRSATLRGLLASDLSSKKGIRVLLAFGGWATLVTTTAPLIFAGYKVLNPREGIDEGVSNPASLTLQISNFAQIGYLIIGIATVATLGTGRRVSPQLPALAFTVGTVLSSGRNLLPESMQKLLIDNSSNVAYTSGEFDGIERMRGIFSEPSALGAFSVAASVFFLINAARGSARQRIFSVIMGVWSFVNAILSFSGGALLSGVIVITIVLSANLYRYAISKLSLTQGAVVFSLSTLPVIYLAGPPVIDFLQLLFSDKASSSSYANRSAADAFSVALTWQSYGLGVGVGSNRPSAFYASLLSTTGLLGFTLFGAAALILVGGALRSAEYAPAGWALLALIVCKMVSGPDLSEPVMWLLLGVCASSIWLARSPSSDTPRPAPCTETAPRAIQGTKMNTPWVGPSGAST